MPGRTPSSASDPRHAITDEDVDAVLEEFGDDARAAIRALLHDLDTLARDHAATVSYGFVRGDVPRLVLPSRGRQVIVALLSEAVSRQCRGQDEAGWAPVE